MELTEKQIKRFWATVNIRSPDDCWPWLGELRDGYGRMQLGSSVNKTRRRLLAHRVACELAHGPASDANLEVAHSCHNPMCCNPTHLRWATHFDNVQDTVKAKRHARGNALSAAIKEYAARGERCARSKLTEEEVRSIRSRYAQEGLTQMALANHFDVTQATISAILRNKTWANI